MRMRVRAIDVCRNDVLVRQEILVEFRKTDDIFEAPVEVVRVVVEPGDDVAFKLECLATSVRVLRDELDARDGIFKG